MKMFNKLVTAAELRKTMKELAYSKGVKRITYNKKAIYVDGTYCCRKKSMFIKLGLTKKNTLHTFFHELAHHVACHRGWWRNYHYNVVTDSEKAFIVENRIDRLAKKLWSCYVDSKVWGRYHFTYTVSQKRTHIKNLDVIYQLD
jgi:hypothetical protein